MAPANPSSSKAPVNPNRPFGIFHAWPNNAPVLESTEAQVSEMLVQNPDAWARELRALYSNSLRHYEELQQLRAGPSIDEISQLRENNAAFVAQNAELLETRNRLEDQIDVMTGLMRNFQPQDHERDQRPGSAKKLPDPEPFSGDIKELDGWIKQIALKLRGNANWYPTEQDKLGYVVGRLRGKAYDQVESMVRETGEVDYNTLDDLFQDLKRAFGDPNRAATAANKISRMRQTNQDFSSYIAEFKREVNHTNWNNSAKKDALLSGLSREIKDALVLTDLRKLDYLEIIDVCQNIDSNRRTLQSYPNSYKLRDYQGKYTPYPAQQLTNRPTSIPLVTPTAPAFPPGDPMDLSAAHLRGPLTEQEKNRRRLENLCLYCAGQGHKARDCPNKPKQRLDVRTLAIEDAPSTFSPSESENL